VIELPISCRKRDDTGGQPGIIIEGLPPTEKIRSLATHEFEAHVCAWKEDYTVQGAGNNRKSRDFGRTYLPWLDIVVQKLETCLAGLNRCHM